MTLTGRYHWTNWASLLAQMVKNLPAMWKAWVQSMGGKIPWRRKWQPTTVFLPGESYGQKSRVGYKPWDCNRAGHNRATKQQLHGDIKAVISDTFWGNQVSRISWLATAPQTQNSQTNNRLVTFQKWKCW